MLARLTTGGSVSVNLVPACGLEFRGGPAATGRNAAGARPRSMIGCHCCKRPASSGSILQYGETDREREELQKQHGIAIHDWPVGDPLCDLDEFAARIAALDMVISVGNTTVHLAGALDVPTLVILPTLPGWRWQLRGETSPWYSSVRCIRQQCEEPWPSVLARAAQQLNLSRDEKQLQTGLNFSPTSVIPMNHKSNELNKALISGRFDVTENLREIQRLIERREWSAAEKLCDEVLIHAPRKPEAWYSLAQIMRATQRGELAIKSLQRGEYPRRPESKLAAGTGRNTINVWPIRRG